MQNYGSTDEEHKKRADVFVQNASRPRQKCCCRKCCPSPALIARFVIRSSIPLIFGLAAGIGLKWINEIIDGPELVIVSSKNNTLLEVSDIISSCITLVVAYSIDWLLNRCWPANPYRQQASGFFQPGSKNSINEDLELLNTNPTIDITV